MSNTYIVWHPTTCTIMLLWSSIPMVLYKEFWKYGFIRTKMNKITLETQFLYKDFLEILKESSSLQWRHNEHSGVQNHLRLDCLLYRLFRCRSKKTPKFRVTSLCEGNSPGTDEFPTQRASNEENVSIWWRHHVTWCIQKQISFHHWMTYTRLFESFDLYSIWIIVMLVWRSCILLRYIFHDDTLLALCSGNSPVTGEFHSQRPVTQSFDVFFDLSLSNPSRRRWFETPSRSL